MREGYNVGRPPLLEGHNYGYWKARIRAFIRTLDENAWGSVEKGWTTPKTKDNEDKVESLWSDDEKKGALGNARALNAIFSAVDENNFRLISAAVSAKEGKLYCQCPGTLASLIPTCATDA